MSPGHFVRSGDIPLRDCRVVVRPLVVGPLDDVVVIGLLDEVEQLDESVKREVGVQADVVRSSAPMFRVGARPATPVSLDSKAGRSGLHLHDGPPPGGDALVGVR